MPATHAIAVSRSAAGVADAGCLHRRAPGDTAHHTPAYRVRYPLCILPPCCFCCCEIPWRLLVYPRCVCIVSRPVIYPGMLHHVLWFVISVGLAGTYRSARGWACLYIGGRYGLVLLPAAPLQPAAFCYTHQRGATTSPLSARQLV